MNEGQFRSFLQGTEAHAYRYMGCHRETRGGQQGYTFRVWAPNAKSVHVAGSFNGWSTTALPMQRLEGGIFEVFTSDANELDIYKYYIEKSKGGFLWKADPYGFYMQRPPESASRIYTLSGYPWEDGAYRRAQARKKLLQNPIHIYELHIGSWRHKEDGSSFSYRELIKILLPYVKEMGFTHIELMPLAEYPNDASWGYQSTGFYAPTSRYGEPKDLMAFIDACHNLGIGVLMDWSPAHFPKDEHGLGDFDGSSCYEPKDPILRESPRRDVRLFDYSRSEVQSFLVSNAVYWLEEFHLDGLRIGSIASILRRDFGRAVWNTAIHGEPEHSAGREFLTKVTQAAASVRNNLILAAEDATNCPDITTPVEEGGLGFTLKWCTDWVDDLRGYLDMDPVYRKYHHENLTFAMTYFYSGQMLLPLSHDEVAAGSRSLIDRMPGWYDDKFADLRAMYGFQMAHPGKKLTFMGNEIAQFASWDEKRSLDWFLLAYDRHRQMQNWVRDLNHFYLDNRPLWHNDTEEDGFRWIRLDDCDHSVLAFRRIDRKGKEIIVICNFCPVVWEHFRLGLPKKGCYLPLLSSDDPAYGGTGVPLSAVRSEPIPCDGLEQSAEFIIPPLSVTFYAPE